MNGDIIPALEHVNLAREHAKLDNFDASIRSYQNALQEVECEIDSCRDRNELVKWNSMLKDIKAEDASIRRIKDTIDEIMGALDDDIDDDFQNQPQGDGDTCIEPPQWSRPDPDENILPQRELKAPDRRSSLNSSKPKRPIRNQTNAGNRGIGRQPLQKPGSRNSRGNSNANMKNNPQNQRGGNQKASNQNQSQNQVSKARPPASANQENTPVDPKQVPIDLESNPLVQQIVDMGILVREPNVQWDQIAGLAQVKRLLRQNLVILPMRPDICKGLLAPWKSVLFYGPPGTGKTFLAKAVATECKRTFFNVTSATITSKWHGESEKLITYLFTLAEQMAPSTIFFDEIDSVASQRGGGQEHEASRRMKAQLLTKLEGIDSAVETSQVFVLAATNFPWDLDEALLRRFQKRIYIPLPDVEGRLAILTMKIKDMVDDDFDLKMWAERLEGYSCADIANLCRDAAQAVFDRQTENLEAEDWLNMPLEQARVIIRDEDFEKAVKLRKSSVDPTTLKKYEQWRLTKGAE
ncbi:Katanin p60 ATPase-containing subunit A1 [Tritrichomonas musculus]|uniref:Katanin p60 ATPase-containing subunit A1 n=1 Tax=Tritrichomonas musculus TaxID=1915356 RepID=A0ABR2K1U2_9EUKA